MTESTRKLITALGAAGHRVTGPRLAVWEAISSASNHMTADEIAARVGTSDPSVNRSSVYRSLALFDELGLVRQSNLGSSEVAHWELSHPDEQFHMRCEVCGRVEHHTGDLVDRVRTHLAENHGFAASRVDLVVSGKCRNCRA